MGWQYCLRRIVLSGKQQFLLLKVFYIPFIMLHFMLDWDIFGVLWKRTQFTICQLYKSVVKDNISLHCCHDCLMIHFGEKTNLCFPVRCRHFIPSAICKSVKCICLFLFFLGLSVWIFDLHFSQIPRSATRRIIVALPCAAICTLSSFMLASDNSAITVLILSWQPGKNILPVIYVPESTADCLWKS